MGTKECVEERAREEGLVKIEKVEEPQIEAPMAEEPEVEVEKHIVSHAGSSCDLGIDITPLADQGGRCCGRAER